MSAAHFLADALEERDSAPHSQATAELSDETLTALRELLKRQRREREERERGGAEVAVQRAELDRLKHGAEEPVWRRCTLTQCPHTPYIGS